MKDSQQRYFKICKRCQDEYRSLKKYSRYCIKCNKRDKNIKKIER